MKERSPELRTESARYERRSESLPIGLDV